MPVLNGLDASRLIKETLPGVQVVLLSAFDSPALRRQAEAAGCFAYLIKGTPAERLRSVLLAAVACRRTPR
jgi:DNA-binding NarL/FixJ family response regulator